MVCMESEACVRGRRGLMGRAGGRGGRGGSELEESKMNNESNGGNKGVLDSALDAHYEKLETNRVAFLRELESTLSSPSAVATSNMSVTAILPC